MTDLRLCCQEIVTIYLALFNPPRLRAALFCPECGARLVCTSIIHDEVTWTEETP